MRHTLVSLLRTLSLEYYRAHSFCRVIRIHRRVLGTWLRHADIWAPLIVGAQKVLLQVFRAKVRC